LQSRALSERGDVSVEVLSDRELFAIIRADHRRKAIATRGVEEQSRSASDISAPSFHQLPTPVQRIATPVGSLRVIAYLVSQCHFGNFALEARFVTCPIAEAGAAPMRRHRRIDRFERMEYGIHA
jgi:hypothetical protein